MIHRSSWPIRECLSAELQMIAPHRRQRPKRKACVTTSPWSWLSRPWQYYFELGSLRPADTVQRPHGLVNRSIKARVCVWSIWDGEDCHCRSVAPATQNPGPTQQLRTKPLLTVILTSVYPLSSFIVQRYLNLIHCPVSCPCKYATTSKLIILTDPSIVVIYYRTRWFSVDSNNRFHAVRPVWRYILSVTIAAFSLAYHWNIAR